MASIRELTQKYIKNIGAPAEIDAEKLFETLFPVSDLLDPASAQKRCARQDFCVAYNELGYYKSYGDYIITEACDDAEKLSAVANRANDDMASANKRYQRFGKRTNQIAGQLVFAVDESGNMSVAQ